MRPLVARARAVSTLIPGASVTVTLKCPSFWTSALAPLTSTVDAPFVVPETSSDAEPETAISSGCRDCDGGRESRSHEMHRHRLADHFAGQASAGKENVVLSLSRELHGGAEGAVFHHRRRAVDEKRRCRRATDQRDGVGSHDPFCRRIDI